MSIQRNDSRRWLKAAVGAVLLVRAIGCADPVSPQADRIADRIASAKGARTIDLFTFDSVEGAGPWRIINDTVMGGRSSSKMTFTDRGTAVFAGTVSLENNGGFAHTRSAAAPYDLAGYEGIGLRVRGDGKRYKLTLKLDRAFDGVLYEAGFATRSGRWIDVRLPFADFVPTYRGNTLHDHPRLDPSAIATIGFIIEEKQEGPFRLEIDQIGAYSAGT